MSNVVLGIDPGFERLGVAVVSGTDARALVSYSGCVRTQAADPFAKRLCALGAEVRTLIEEYQPDALAIETLLFNTNQKTAMRVAEARGVVLYEAARAGVSVFEYTPMQIKIAVAGYGKAPKEQVALMVKQLVTLQQRSRLDDELDAIAVALTHRAHVPYRS